MVLALDYMQTTETADPALEAKAKRYVAQGYERLLTFESKQQPGGFALWVGGKPTVFLTAYGLMQFVDMRRVHTVDPALITRMRAFLRARQMADGSFDAGNLAHRWGPWKETSFYMTAYVAWALARAGEDTTKARAWLDAHADEVADPYGVALAALAFAAVDPASAATRRWTRRLVALQSDGPARGSWNAAKGTYVGGRGVTATIETTAMAALLLLQTKLDPTLAHEALDRLVERRGRDGRSGSTHSTALALRALLASSTGSEALPASQVLVRRGGEVVRRIDVPKDSTEPQRIDLGMLDPAQLELALAGEGRIRGTLSRTTYEPWDTRRAPKGPLTLAVSFGDGDLAVDRAYVARVTVRNTGTEPAKVVTAEIGLPPGITVEPKDASGEGLNEAERAARHLVLYLDDLAPGAERTILVPFRTRYRFTARTAPSRVYEYYVEHEQTVVGPLPLRCR